MPVMQVIERSAPRFWCLTITSITTMCGKPASRPAKVEKAHRVRGGDRMFDPYGAERHSRRTRQQRKAAPRGRGLRRARRDCAPNAVRCPRPGGI
jgi:hypothetical protein